MGKWKTNSFAGVVDYSLTMQFAQDLSLSFSFFAVLLSGFAVFWEVARSRWERPVVAVLFKVTTRAVQGPGAANSPTPNPSQRDFFFQMTVSNVGERAVTINRAGFSKNPDGQFLGTFPAVEGSVDLPCVFGVYGMATLGARRMDKNTFEGETAWPFVEAVLRPTRSERKRGILGPRLIYGAPMVVREAAAEL